MDDVTPTNETVAIPVVIGIAAVGECVLWTGYRMPNGYGQLCVDGRHVYAHRYAWACVHGDPGTLCVLHRCDVRACINVNHLFLGTQADNMADMIAKGRKACLDGEQHARAKLTDDQVRQIRSSTESGPVIARRLGVSNTTVYGIRSRKTWVRVTNGDNMDDQNAIARVANGERHGRAKLTAAQVCEIRASSESGLVIALRLGISTSTVSLIRLRKRWAHVV